ncbi:type II toxin-antitoxin system RelE/ParE family toxin [Glycomyces paridis]|uniref:Type II toxin-antitoxin system RelE/ParE family toxin n=1 Tax=Glycomyces paridis TaxID=2126555 RepID=A0A4S8P0X4_9ACTN|nr:type II toxin-antitoxin system RelE/ParE family toxin [Glycomyces paridis]
MQYRVEFNEEAQKQLAKLDKPVRTRVVLALDKLQSNPRPDGVKKLKGHDDRWRIRVGDWRVVYRIDDGVLIVIVIGIGIGIGIGHRSSVYKGK